MKNSQLKDLRVMIIELLWTFKDSLRFAFMNKTETKQHKDARVCMCVRACAHVCILPFQVLR